MADSVALSVFAPPLVRLLLCGGGGLLAAWGPVFAIARGVWDPLVGVVREPTGRREYNPLAPQHYGPHLPLDPASPWPARMAVVAAWMLGEPERLHGGCVYLDDLLNVEWLIEGERKRMFWNPATGEDCWNDRCSAFDLPTLPAHLANHPPEVALLLALYDVPAIRERVEAP